jgi:hypothetical protein
LIWSANEEAEARLGEQLKESMENLKAQRADPFHGEAQPPLIQVTQCSTYATS